MILIIRLMDELCTRGQVDYRGDFSFLFRSSRPIQRTRLVEHYGLAGISRNSSCRSDFVPGILLKQEQTSKFA